MKQGKGNRGKEAGERKQGGEKGCGAEKDRQVPESRPVSLSAGGCDAAGAGVVWLQRQPAGDTGYGDGIRRE